MTSDLSADPSVDRAAEPVPTARVDRPFRSDSTAMPVPLAQLLPGQLARFVRADLLDEDSQLLSALGLTQRCRFRVAKAGDPWILQVHGTRIGLSRAVAHRILVLPEP